MLYQNSNVVNQSLSLLNDTSVSDRQQSQEKRLSMYLDSYEPEVIKLLRKQFHPDNFARLFPMVAKYYNTFKKIVNLKSVIYKREAIRKWYQRDGKTIDDNYSELLNKTDINTVLQLTNKLTNVNNTSFVRIIPDLENKTIKYSAVPSELINLTQNPNNPNEIQSILHRVCAFDSFTKLNNMRGSRADHCEVSRSYESKYFYWDKEKYIIYNGNYEVIPQPDNPENINPYGIIPYVLFSNLPSISGSIWNETVNDDLYSGTIQINVLQTYLNNAIKLLGFKQPWITGISGDEAKGLSNRVTDGLQPIFIAQSEAKIGAVELTGGVKEIRDSIHDVISEIADNHGVSFSSRTSSAQKSSGLALQIEAEQLENIRVEQQPLYRLSETELAEKTIVISNKDLGTNIDIEGSFSINFFEDKDKLSQQDKLKQDAFDLKHNIKSVVDLYRENDPDVTDDKDVIQRINYNKKINDELLTTDFNLDITEDDDGEE